MKAFYRFLFFLSALLAFAGCSSSPASKLLGEIRDNTKARRQTTLPTQPLSDRRAIIYLEEVGKKLEGQAGTHTSFFYSALETSLVQGQANWAGNILVTRGMLNVIENEAELACLLGHEIGHVALKHGAPKKSFLPSSAYAGFSSLVKKYTGLEISSSQLETVEQAFWKRTQEQEADEYGALLAQKAGYNPYALAALFRRLSSIASYGILDWLDTPERSHAYLLSRASHLESFLKSKAISPQGKIFSERYQQKLGFLDKRTLSTLKKIEDIQKKATHLSKTPLPLNEFMQIMGELSEVAQKHHLLKYFSLGPGERFMAESIEQETPLWGNLSSVAEKLKQTLAVLSRVAVGNLPVVGDAMDLYEAIAGQDFFTGEKLTPTQRALAALGVLVGSGKTYRETADAMRSMAHSVEEGAEIERSVNKAEQFFEKEANTAKAFEPDIQLPQSVGARVADLDLGGGLRLPAGSKITGVENIAKGSGIREVDRLVAEYGGKPKNWIKRKGYTRVVAEDGSSVLAEVHWYEAHGVGRVEYKVKRTE